MFNLLHGWLYQNLEFYANVEIFLQGPMLIVSIQKGCIPYVISFRGSIPKRYGWGTQEEEK